MNKTQKRKIGDIGEEIAVKFLKKRKYTIIDQNYLKQHGEIDIIAQNKGILHFIEVKTVRYKFSRETERSTVARETYNPAQNVHRDKLRRIYKTAYSYLNEKNVPRATKWQIDVITVLLDLHTKQAKVEYLEDVVL